MVMETNSDSGISCGTIYRPEDLGGAEKYPIFVWGEGACTRNGTSNQAAMAEIASHGYFVVADGPPTGGGNCGSIAMSSDVEGMAKPLLEYITWAIDENSKTCSAYFQSLDTTKVAADGFSCGGLMAEGTAGDPRMTTWGVTSSGMTSPNQALYDVVHTPVKILLGGPSDVAYENGQRDYQNISPLGFPIVLFSKDIGHGGDLGGKTGNGGDFTKINLAWLNWQLKGDETATGKGFLVGDTCTFCKDSAWEVKSANIP
ncbi:MAG: alpha/beta hydrolase [Polyangiaceae bacterium]|nr:alpha/beta hydrolase [Polyangiaceae bacterium]